MITIPTDPNSFLSCGEDGTVQWFDLRSKRECKKRNCTDNIVINCGLPVTAIAINPVRPYELAVGCTDCGALFFDMRKLASNVSISGSYLTALDAIYYCTIPALTKKTYRITSLTYNEMGKIF